LRTDDANEETMISRRQVLVSGSAMVLAGSAGRAQAAPVLTDDGLYSEPWFINSFLDLRDDLADATANKKRFAIMWELKGCPYCKETHFVNFADPTIQHYVKNNFAIVQLNVIGTREVTDFDGTKMTEKQFSQKYNVRFTPTFQFFPENLAEFVDKSPDKREVARLPGYLKPAHFLTLFRFVREKGYERGDFRSYLKAQGD